MKVTLWSKIDENCHGPAGSTKVIAQCRCSGCLVAMKEEIFLLQDCIRLYSVWMHWTVVVK